MLKGAGQLRCVMLRANHTVKSFRVAFLGGGNQTFICTFNQCFSFSASTLVRIEACGSLKNPMPILTSDFDFLQPKVSWKA